MMRWPLGASSGVSQEDRRYSFRAHGQPYCRYTGSCGREGRLVLLGKGGQLFSLPLPPDNQPKLGYPYNLTLPLPPATGKPQPYRLPFLSMRVIPNPEFEKTPYAVTELNTPLWELTQGPIFAGENASVDLRSSDKDPLYKLPAAYVLSGIYLPGGEMQLSQVFPAQPLLK